MSILERTVDRRNDYVGAPLKRVSLASIFSGVVVGLAVSVALTMLGVTVGLLGPERSAEIGIASGATWALVAVLSLFAGGWTAGRLCGLRRSFEGAMHGFITWAVMSVALLMFAGSFTLASYGTSTPPAPGGFMGLEEMRESMGPDPMTSRETPRMMRTHERIERDCHALIDGTTLSPDEKTALKEKLRPEIAALVAGVKRGDPDEARMQLIDTLQNETEIDKADITAAVDRIIDMARKKEVRSERRRKGPKHKRDRRYRPGAAISGDSRAFAGWSFLFIFLGAAGALFGGWVGSGSMSRAASEIMAAPQEEPTPKPPSSDSNDGD